MIKRRNGEPSFVVRLEHYLVLNRTSLAASLARPLVRFPLPVEYKTAGIYHVPSYLLRNPKAIRRILFDQLLRHIGKVSNHWHP